MFQILFSKKSWRFRLFFIAVPFFLLSINSIYADPPRCETYQVVITLHNGNIISGRIQTSTSEYVLYHEPGALQATDFLKPRIADSKKTDNILNIYEEIHQFSIPKGFTIVSLSRDHVTLVDKDSISAIKIQSKSSCSGNNQYSYFFPSSIYQLPLECIKKLKNNQYTFYKVHKGSDIVCWFAVDKDRINPEILRKKFEIIRKENNWYHKHRDINTDLWKNEKMVLICHALEW